MTALLTVIDARIGKDPILKTVGETELTEFSIATNEGYGDKQITTWLECKVWGSRAKAAHDYLKKGDKIVVHGRFYCRKYTKKDGTEGMSNELNVTEFTLPPKKDDSAPKNSEAWPE